MAIRKNRSAVNLAVLVLIARGDDAVDHKAEGCNYDEYLKDLDESKLKFVPSVEPTRYLLNMNFDGKSSRRIDNAMIATKDDEDKPTVALGTWRFAVAQHALKGIQNPSDLKPFEGIEFVKDENGLASEELINEISKYGVVQDIFAVYTNLVLSPKKAAAKN